MLRASEVYRKFQKEIDSKMAKDKLITGTTNCKGIYVVKKALSLLNKGTELHYYDDLSTITADKMKVLKELEDSDTRYSFRYNDVSEISIYSNLDTINYKDDNSRSMAVHMIGYEGDTKVLRVSTTNSVALSGFEGVKKCLVGYNNNTFQGNFVYVNSDSYSLVNCFNNQHYDYVYLSANEDPLGHTNCFNNCTIDTLVINDVELHKKISLTDCFKFTSANNIQVVGTDDASKHLVNRLTYMRGVHNV